MLFFSFDYLIFICSVIWLLSFIGFFFSQNFIIILISLELMFLSICTIFCAFSCSLEDLNGQIFALFILGVVACESALALASYVIVFYCFQNLKK